MDQINKKIGEYLLKPGNSRTALAREIGLSTFTLNSRIAGKSEWKWGEVVKLAEVIGCSLDDLL